MLKPAWMVRLEHLDVAEGAGFTRADISTIKGRLLQLPEADRALFFSDSARETYYALLTLLTGNMAAAQNPTAAPGHQQQLAPAVHAALPAALSPPATGETEQYQRCIRLFAEAIWHVAKARSLEAPRLLSFANPTGRSWTTEMCNGRWHKVVIVDVLKDYMALFDHIRFGGLATKYGINMTIVNTMHADPWNVVESIYQHVFDFQASLALLDRSLVSNVIANTPSVQFRLSWPDSSYDLTY